MNTITLTKADLRKILDSEIYLKGDFEKHNRHNGGDQDIIFEKDGKHYRTTYRWFEDDGLDWQPNYDAVEVKQVEQLVKVWVNV